jgi:hypothetical protein
MSESEKTQSPSQILAKRIARRLVDKGLINNELASKIEHKIAQGKMQAPDWKLTFEMSLDLHKGSKKE